MRSIKIRWRIIRLIESYRPGLVLLVGESNRDASRSNTGTINSPKAFSLSQCFSRPKTKLNHHPKALIA